MQTTVTTNPPHWLVYICVACGLLYKEVDGDPDSGIAPGTLFVDIPEDWMCPLCGVTKADFVLLEESQVPQVFADVDSQKLSIASHGLLPRSRYSDVLIIGAGKAGWEVAAALRKVSQSLSITIVTGCNGDIYDKPQLSVAIQKRISLDQLVREKGSDAAHRLQVQLFNNTHAVHISPSIKHLRTTKGVFKYGNLVIAQGAKPFKHQHLPVQDCWHVNHLSNYRELRCALENKKSSIAVIGAGLIGCELANDLALDNHSITLIDSAARPLAHLIPQAVSEALIRSWEKLSIQFLGTQVITGISYKDNQKILSMSAGQQLSFDHIVICMGLQPDNTLAESAGLVWHQGIAVDPQTLMTSMPAIYAIGDCISIGGKTSRFIEPIIRQAHVIAHQISGHTATTFNVQAIPIRIKTSALPMRIEGQIQSQGVWKASQKDGDTNPKKWQMRQWHNDQAGALIEIG